MVSTRRVTDVERAYLLASGERTIETFTRLEYNRLLSEELETRAPADPLASRHTALRGYDLTYTMLPILSVRITPPGTDSVIPAVYYDTHTK